LRTSFTTSITSSRSASNRFSRALSFSISRGRYSVRECHNATVQSVARPSPIMATREKGGHLHYFTKETAIATLLYTGHRVAAVEWINTRADQ
jgi:hypothetical protein